MATLTVTETHDYTGEIALFPSTDQIVFNTSALSTTATFGSDDFGLAARILHNVAITGDANVNQIVVNLAAGATFSAAGWTFSTWSANDVVTLNGSSGADTITGSTQRNIIKGGLGADILTGGALADTFVYVTASDAVAGEIVDGKGGFNTISAGDNGSFHFETITILNVGRLLFADSGSQTVTLDASQIGAGGIGLVEGGAGTDALIVEGQNVDLSSLIFINWAAFISIGGTVGDDTIIGSAQGDSIQTGPGADLLDGGFGNDVLRGGAGNDTYIIDDIDDIVDEAAAGSSGTDLVKSSIDFNLGDINHAKGDLENLTLLSDATTGTGNALANVITGNNAINFLFGAGGNDKLNGAGGDDTLSGDAGNDTLDGGTGADIMRGLGGNDTYIVDNAGDIVDESVIGSSGTDLIKSFISFSLADGVHALGGIENLTLLGAAGINGAGNGLANVITGNSGSNALSGAGGNDTLIGNSGNDALDGGSGADVMKGGAGNDTYIVDNASDVVDEGAAGSNGTDVVRTSISFSLADGAHAKGNIENLTLLGAAGINGAGNGLANVVTGNSGDNVLNGGAGDDVITGGGGKDTLSGGADSDAFVFATLQDSGKKAKSRDTILDFNQTDDLIDLSLIDAKPGKADNAFKFIGKKGFHNKKGELQYKVKKGDALVSGDVNGDGKADFSILVDNVTKLKEFDFVL